MAVIFIIIGVFIYFIPSIVAGSKKQFSSVVLLNIFLGWTFIGWVVALVWAASGETEQEERLKVNNNTPVSDQLAKLIELKQQGVLSEEEFNSAKSKILK